MLAAAPRRTASQRPSRCTPLSTAARPPVIVQRPRKNGAASAALPRRGKAIVARGKIDDDYGARATTPLSSSPSPSSEAASASTTTPPTTTTTTPTTPKTPGPAEDAWQPGQPPTPFMLDRAAFLERDLPHLFDGVGIDARAYADRVEFRDPITSYGSLRGYLFNIAALRRVFSPTFVLLGVRQTGKRDLTTRWAMEMEVGGSGGSGGENNNNSSNSGGLLPAALRPKLAFTGTSILTFDDAGKICRHVDTWDSLGEAEQGYFSVAGARNVVAQLLDVRKAPASPASSSSSPGSSGDLWSPPRQLLRKTAKYEIRRYEDLPVIEAPMARELGPASAPSSSSSSSPSVTGPGARSAFRSLASFIGREKISMTTPVLSDSRAMRFVLAPGEAEERARRASAASSAAASSAAAAADAADDAAASASSPSSSSSSSSSSPVAVSKVKGGIYAVLAFGGIATDASSAAAARELQAALGADGVAVAAAAGGGGSSSSRSSSSPPFLLAQYNGPVTLPPFRLNEVLIRLDEDKFDLWAV